MTTHHTTPSPSLSVSSPVPGAMLPLMQPRHRDRGSYIQRWKVLRDRNKKLPKLDFIAKANGIPKRYQASGFSRKSSRMARSYTYGTINLPSLSTSSVINGASNKSINSDGIRQRDQREKKAVQDLNESMKDYKEKEPVDLNTSVSNSLHNVSPEIPETSSYYEQNNKHRYETISYSKRLSNRQNGPVKTVKEKTALLPDNSTQSDLRRERESILNNLRREKETYKSERRLDVDKIPSKRRAGDKIEVYL